MQNFNYTYLSIPKHLTKEEYDEIINFVTKATEDQIQEFLGVIGVRFSGENEGIDKEQVMGVAGADTKNPEIKQKMLEFIRKTNN